MKDWGSSGRVLIAVASSVNGRKVLWIASSVTGRRRVEADRTG